MSVTLSLPAVLAILAAIYLLLGMPLIVHMAIGLRLKPGWAAACRIVWLVISWYPVAILAVIESRAEEERRKRNQRRFREWHDNAIRREGEGDAES